MNTDGQRGQTGGSIGEQTTPREPSGDDSPPMSQLELLFGKPVSARGHAQRIANDEPGHVGSKLGTPKLERARGEGGLHRGWGRAGGGGLHRAGVGAAARDEKDQVQRGQSQSSFKEGGARVSISPDISGVTLGGAADQEARAQSLEGVGGEGGGVGGVGVGAEGGGVSGEGGGDGGGASHSQQPGSAWQNVHAKGKLRLLMAGLVNDYGLEELLSGHHIVGTTFDRLLALFRDLVLDDPDEAFLGEGGQEVQSAVSALCYHGNFRADAVMKKKPIKARGTSGRTYTFAVPSAGKKAERSGPFAKERKELITKMFVPRLVELAQENFPEELENHERIARIVDLRDPQHWYPLARLRKRRIIYHGGPTNSGKTYQAIERLKKAGANRKPGDGPSGIFCGPLRLLALEVYEQLNSQGVYCSLMTGQERREVPFASHVSCTIEMASTTNEYEVAVIDEIQMLADEQRGASWTAAVLGLNCPEIHVCGGMEGAVLVEALAKETGDEFELREYQRKTELVCAKESLNNNYKNVEAGKGWRRHFFK
eukprot:jgi/Undpi1/443/HiC_scaffold_1.g00439.m1